MKFVILEISVAAALCCHGGEVTLREEKMPLPTYAIGPAEKNPIFYTGSINQGAQGRAYPYALQDKLGEKRAEQSYRALKLGNEYLDLTVMPELGGRIFALTDKATGHEVFYRQHVVKPALIGLLGAWISGGVEWNFPHHHRATTYQTVDSVAVTNADNSKTIWVGETERRNRLKWSMGLSLVPGKDVLQAEGRFMNPQPYLASMLYWANVAVHCGTNYQVIFPPSCRIGFDHHKSSFTPFPIGRPNPALDRITDLSWWKNFDTCSRSIFAYDHDNDFLAGYDHAADFGTVHVSNHQIVCGKKFFLWGNNQEGFVWDKVLTEHDGPYLELMVGAWSDNQPDYSWIAPYETRVCKQYWYPLKKIGGVKCANLDAAINLERRAPDKVFLGFNTTLPVQNAKAELLAAGESVFFEIISIDPNTPYLQTVTIKPALKDQELTGRLLAPDGRELVRYTPVADVQPPLPSPAEPFRDPAEYKTAEELYLAGQRLEQFHNAVYDPIPYYEEALRRDPGDARANLALGIRRAREAKFAEAETLLRRSIARNTWNYTRAKDAEPHYYLGVILAEQGNLKEAEDELWKAVWRDTFQRAGYLELARIACRHGDYPAALERVDEAIAVAAKSAFAHTLRGYILRKLGRSAEAAEALNRAAACDPLDVWSRAERRFLANDPAGALAALSAACGDKLQQTLEVVCDYLNAGASAEPLALLGAAKTVGGAFASPLVDYYKGYLLALSGDVNGAKAAFHAAAAMPGEYCFPYRHEELRILEKAAALAPEEAATWNYLGEILTFYEQREQGIAAWQKAVKCNPRHALALRNLGFALGRMNGRAREGLAYYRQSLAVDAANATTLVEADKLAEQVGEPAAARLAYLESLRKTVESSDPAMLRLAVLYNATEQFDKSLAILTTRRFHVWEGAEALRQPFVDAALLRGIHRLKSGDAAAALEDFNLADTYPENLQAGRPGNVGQSPKIHYYAALAYRKLGRKEDEQRSLRQVLAGGKVSAEMLFYRALAARELGDAAGEKRQAALLKETIAELEKPARLDAYAKFNGANDQILERPVEALFARGLVAVLEKRPDEAIKTFQSLLAKHPARLWARYWIAEETLAGGGRRLPFESAPALANAVRALGGVAEMPAWGALADKDFFPCIDRYGQFRHADWPGKIHADADFAAAAAAERADLAAHPGPANWDRFGGWAAGPKRAATGSFRVEKVGGRWWLVDPDGFLYWANGVVRVAPSSAVAPLDFRNFCFAWLPPPDSPLATFYSTMDSSLAPSYRLWCIGRTFDFSGANLFRKYGPAWQTAFADLVHRRLRSWGCNHIANTSDSAICAMDRTPYTVRIDLAAPPIAAAGNLLARFPFPDPFDPAFRVEIRNRLAAYRREAADPWCVGFFIDNLLNWGKPGDLARWAFAATGGSAAKAALLAWKSSHGGAGKLPGEEDFKAFSLVIAEEYFSVVSEEFREAVPGKLFLGCHFDSSGPEFAVRAAAPHCDALCYHLFAKSAAELHPPAGVDKPVLIGEYHFGAIDRGPLYPGLVAVKNQTERGDCVLGYLRSALANPNVVGAFWHQYCDQPTIGRFDGEAFQDGLVDLCDTPYPETRSAFRQIGSELYK